MIDITTKILLENNWKCDFSVSNFRHKYLFLIRSLQWDNVYSKWSYDEKL